MKNKKILISPSTFGVNSVKPINKLKKTGFKLIFNNFNRKLTDLELENILDTNNVIGVIAGLEKYSKAILNKYNLKIISRVGSGIDNIDIKTAKNKNIKIFTTPTAPIDAVAELTIGMMISLLRKSIISDENIKNGKWTRIFGNLLKNKKVLIVGYGRIGKRVHKLLQAFESECYIFDPFIKKKNKYFIDELNKNIELFDIITCHTSGDREILGHQHFKDLKKNICILNSSRGEAISEENLYKFLKTNKEASAWIDVFKKEPYYGKLTKLKNILLTPHISSYTVETRINMENEAVDNLIKNLKYLD